MINISFDHRQIEHNNMQVREIPTLSAIKSTINYTGPYVSFIPEPFYNSTRMQGTICNDSSKTGIEKIALLKEKVNQIITDFNNTLSNTNLTGEDLQVAKAMLIYNYILGNVRYSPELHTENGGIISDYRYPNTHNVYGALVDNIAVCTGQSEAFYILASLMGLECKRVMDPNIDHTFNIVKMGDNWHKCDVTAEMNFSVSGIPSGRWKQDCFLREWDCIGSTVSNSRIPETFSPIHCRHYPDNRIIDIKNQLSRSGISFDYNFQRTYVPTLYDALKIVTHRINQKSNTENQINISPKISVLKRSDNRLIPEKFIPKMQENLKIVFNNENVIKSNDRYFVDDKNNIIHFNDNQVTTLTPTRNLNPEFIIRYGKNGKLEKIYTTDKFGNNLTEIPLYKPHIHKNTVKSFFK